MAEGTITAPLAVDVQLIYIINQEPLIGNYAERFLGARTTTNLPFTCVYGFGRTCQGVATGINNKQLIIWFGILWPKHGCQIFVTFVFYLGPEIKSERHTDWISDVSLFCPLTVWWEMTKARFVHFINKFETITEAVYCFSALATHLWAKKTPKLNSGTLSLGLNGIVFKQYCNCV